MLKARLTGTRNGISWFGKILQRNPKIEVIELSDLFSNRGMKKYYRVYVEVRENNVKEEQQIIKRDGTMCKIIAIMNQKGGVDKTTAISNLGIGLIKQGRKVLLISADAQSSPTTSLRYTEPDTLEITSVATTGDLINDEEVESIEGILHHGGGIDLMPGNTELPGLEVSFVSVTSREIVLRSYIEIVRENYGHTLIDCVPSLGITAANALTCADGILIPVQTAYLPARGLQQLIKMADEVKRKIDPKLRIGGILLAMVDGRVNYAKDISSTLRSAYRSSVRIFINTVPTSVETVEILVGGVSIYKHDPKGRVAAVYDSSTREVLIDGQ